MLVVFCRHGRSEANDLRIFSNRGYRHGLTAEGREQAERLGAVLADLEPRPRALYASPLKRAHETASIAGRILGLDPVLEDRLAEFDVGLLEGRADAEAWAEFQELWDAWFGPARGDEERRLPEGESLRELRSRIWDFLDAVYREHPGDCVVALSHGGLLRALLSLLMDPAAIEGHGIGHADHFTVLYEGRRGEASLAGLKLSPL